MTKHLRKLIMNRSRSKNTYLKNRAAGNWETFPILCNKCTKETIGQDAKNKTRNVILIICAYFEAPKGQKVFFSYSIYLNGCD